MYVPSHFNESRREVLHALIRTQPLAALVTLSPAGLDANHIPLYLVPDRGEQGVLWGHVARHNPVWRDTTPDHEALAIFQGPSSYISPSWYPTKKAHGKVVPTWNYVAVHAYGALRVHDDPAWVRRQVERLTQQVEAPRAQPWAVADAPPEYVERLIQGIVGIELVIHRLLGQWKVSQNQPEGNRRGVAVGLAATGQPVAIAMAQLSKQHIPE